MLFLVLFVVLNVVQYGFPSILNVCHLAAVLNEMLKCALVERYVKTI